METVALLFGPGSIHVAHTENERISKRELLEAVEKYIQIARTLLTTKSPLLDGEGREVLHRALQAVEST